MESCVITLSAYRWTSTSGVWMLTWQGLKQNLKRSHQEHLLECWRHRKMAKLSKANRQKIKQVHLTATFYYIILQWGIFHFHSRKEQRLAYKMSFRSQLLKVIFAWPIVPAQSKSQGSHQVPTWKTGKPRNLTLVRKKAGKVEWVGEKSGKCVLPVVCYRDCDVKLLS